MDVAADEPQYEQGEHGPEDGPFDYLAFLGGLLVACLCTYA